MYNDDNYIICRYLSRMVDYMDQKIDPMCRETTMNYNIFYAMYRVVLYLNYCNHRTRPVAHLMQLPT